MAHYIPAYRLAWRTRAMQGPSFWYFRTPEAALQCKRHLESDDCAVDVSVTRVPANTPCHDPWQDEGGEA